MLGTWNSLEARAWYLLKETFLCALDNVQNSPSSPLSCVGICFLIILAVVPPWVTGPLFLKFSATVMETRLAVTKDILRGERLGSGNIRNSWREAQESSDLVFSTNAATEILGSIFCLQFLIFLCIFLCFLRLLCRKFGLVNSRYFFYEDFFPSTFNLALRWESL